MNDPRSQLHIHSARPHGALKQREEPVDEQRERGGR